MPSTQRLDARCPNCKSVLVRLIITPTLDSETAEKGHIDVYCGVCGAFVLDLWYTNIRDCNGLNVNEILKEQNEESLST